MVAGLLQAAEQGNAQAQNQFGPMYAEGMGVKVNPERAATKPRSS